MVFQEWFIFYEPRKSLSPSRKSVNAKIGALEYLRIYYKKENYNGFYATSDTGYEKLDFMVSYKQKL
jgi:hypothetical protein